MPEISPSRYLVQAGWKDVPHLDAKTQREILDSTEPYLRAARSEGAPSLGSGAIFPIDWSEVSVDPFQIPNYWKRAYGFDVGWNMTVAIWGATDPADGVTYCYSEYAMGKATPATHAAAIRARGEWIPGAIDPAARGRSQDEGKTLYASYTDLGLHLTLADNRVKGEGGGLDVVWQRLSAGRIKIFRTLVGMESEYREYRRDDNGKVVKENDHRMDAFRYLVMTGPEIAMHKPTALAPDHSGYSSSDETAGY